MAEGELTVDDEMTLDDLCEYCEREMRGGDAGRWRERQCARAVLSLLREVRTDRHCGDGWIRDIDALLAAAAAGRTPDEGEWSGPHEGVDHVRKWVQEVEVDPQNNYKQTMLRWRYSECTPATGDTGTPRTTCGDCSRDAFSCEGCKPTPATADGPEPIRANLPPQTRPDVVVLPAGTGDSAPLHKHSDVDETKRDSKMACPNCGRSAYVRSEGPFVCLSCGREASPLDPPYPQIGDPGAEAWIQGAAPIEAAPTDSAESVARQAFAETGRVERKLDRAVGELERRFEARSLVRDAALNGALVRIAELEAWRQDGTGCAERHDWNTPEARARAEAVVEATCGTEPTHEERIAALESEDQHLSLWDAINGLEDAVSRLRGSDGLEKCEPRARADADIAALERRMTTIEQSEAATDPRLNNHAEWLAGLEKRMAGNGGWTPRSPGPEPTHETALVVLGGLVGWLLDQMRILRGEVRSPLAAGRRACADPSLS